MGGAVTNSISAPEKGITSPGSLPLTFVMESHLAEPTPSLLITVSKSYCMVAPPKRYTFWPLWGLYANYIRFGGKGKIDKSYSS